MQTGRRTRNLSQNRGTVPGRHRRTSRPWHPSANRTASLTAASHSGFAIFYYRLRPFQGRSVMNHLHPVAAFACGGLATGYCRVGFQPAVRATVRVRPTHEIAFALLCRAYRMWVSQTRGECILLEGGHHQEERRFDRGAEADHNVRQAIDATAQSHQNRGREERPGRTTTQKTRLLSRKCSA